MAKSKAPSKRSRAARRATSPSINTDKSLKNMSLPVSASASALRTAHRPSVLAAHRSAGVSKKTKRGRKSQLSTKARRRQEKGLEMAEAILERTSNKVQKSAVRARVVRERSKAWDEVNKAAVVEDPAEAPRIAYGEGDGGDKAWETDEEMDAEDAGKTAAATALPVVDEDGDIL